MDEQILSKVREHFRGSKPITCPKGRTIIMAGREPEGVFFLREGIVEQYDITPEGNKITVNVFKPPAFFPMSWAINRTPNTYFFEALTEVRLQRAEPDATVAFLRANPDVAFDLLARVYKGTDALLKRLALAAGGIASSRLVFELLIEAYRFGTEGGGGKRVVKIKQNILAARSGLARETISRELHKLEEAAVIKRTGQGLEINTKALEEKLDINV